MAITKEQIFNERTMTRSCFDTEEKCEEGLINTYKMFKSITLTRKRLLCIKKSLSLMFLYCPESFKGTVENAMIEAEIIDGFLSVTRWEKKEN